uniref:Uncharacterized protein n=1 Tax=Mola mola TaxID=94237 RepID=A0A3Q3W156_MOLML
MPLKDERPTSTSSGEDQGSDGESSSERCDSVTSASDLDCSRESFTSDSSSKHCTPSSSPPKTLTLEEVMDSARELSNLNIAHEISVNPNFQVGQCSHPKGRYTVNQTLASFFHVFLLCLYLQASLRGQICSLTQKDNPIRTLVEDRVQQYFKGLICDVKPQAKLEQVPAGLSTIKPELASLGAKFISLVNYNKAVYGPFYADIIRKLMFGGSPPAANLLQDSAQESVPSN